MVFLLDVEHMQNIKMITILLFLMLFFLLNVVLDFTNYNIHTCISSSVTPKSADNYIAVYIGVGAFV
jgi:uncharacterized membrane protein